MMAICCAIRFSPPVPCPAFISKRSRSNRTALGRCRCRITMASMPRIWPTMPSSPRRRRVLASTSIVTFTTSARPELFRRVLHLAVAERPILAGIIDQGDPDVLFAHALLFVKLVGDAPVEFFLHLGRATGDPGDLDEDDVGRVVDAEIAVLRINDFIGGMTRDDLKFVVHRYI